MAVCSAMLIKMFKVWIRWSSFCNVMNERRGWCGWVIWSLAPVFHLIDFLENWGLFAAGRIICHYYQTSFLFLSLKIHWMVVMWSCYTKVSVLNGTKVKVKPAFKLALGTQNVLQYCLKIFVAVIWWNNDSVFWSTLLWFCWSQSLEKYSHPMRLLCFVTLEFFVTNHHKIWCNYGTLFRYMLCSCWDCIFPFFFSRRSSNRISSLKVSLFRFFQWISCGL